MVPVDFKGCHASIYSTIRSKPKWFRWILRDTTLALIQRYVWNLTEAEIRNDSIELEKSLYGKFWSSYEEKLTITPAVNFETKEDYGSNLFLNQVIKQLQHLYLLKMSLLNVIFTCIWLVFMNGYLVLKWCLIKGRNASSSRKNHRKMREATGKIIGRCLEAGVRYGIEDLLVLHN